MPRLSADSTLKSATQAVPAVAEVRPKLFDLPIDGQSFGRTRGPDASTSYSSISIGSTTLGGRRHLTIFDAAIGDRLRTSIRTLQLPPEAGLVAEAGVVVLDFLCIFLDEVAPAGAMVFVPDAPDTVSVDPPALGLLMPVPP